MKKLGIVFTLSFFAQLSFAQDFQLLNQNQALIYLNPSFAGSNGGVRNQTSYRNQWPTLPASMQTYVNSTDFYIKPLGAGIAVSLWSDQPIPGVLKTNAASLSYAQILSFSNKKWQIIPSVQFLYGNKTLDRNALHYGDPIDPRLGVTYKGPELPSPRKNYFDFGAGFLTRYKNDFYAGAYLFHFNQPDVGLLGSEKLPARLVVHASYTKHFSDLTSLQFFYKYQYQNTFITNQIALNLILWKHFVTGMSYVTGDAVLFNLGYRSEYISLGLGYDVTVSRLAGNAAGAWEAHLGVNLRKKDQRGLVKNFEN